MITIEQTTNAILTMLGADTPTTRQQVTDQLTELIKQFLNAPFPWIKGDHPTLEPFNARLYLVATIYNNPVTQEAFRTVTILYYDSDSRQWYDPDSGMAIEDEIVVAYYPVPVYDYEA
jgi:hypothetical protein